jgi:hypothetical protein
MTTDFFNKKRLSFAAKTAAVVFIFCALFYAWFLNQAERYPYRKRFYFLVDTSTHLDACVVGATLQGGAGYIVADDEREYSALSVYLTESAGNTAKNSLLDEQSYSLIEKRVDGLYFKTRQEKRKKTRILSAFQCLDDCIEVLNGEIKRLEESATQQSTKRVLNELKKQFIYLSNVYRKDFPSYARVCAKADRDLEMVVGGIVYAKDLRYMCCQLCDSFVKLSEEYAL